MQSLNHQTPKKSCSVLCSGLILLHTRSPLIYNTPSYVGLGCGQGWHGFPLTLCSSPESWHDQGENHEVIVWSSNSWINVITGHLPAWKRRRTWVSVQWSQVQGKCAPRLTLWKKNNTILWGIQNHHPTQAMLLIRLLWSKTLKLSEQDLCSVCIVFSSVSKAKVGIIYVLCPWGVEHSRECEHDQLIFL